MRNTIESYADLPSSRKHELETTYELFTSIGPKERLERTHVISRFKDTGSTKPISQRQYALSSVIQEHLSKETNRW